MTARNLSASAIDKRRAEGVAVISVAENRWGRCDIKTTGLLANVLAKTEARKAGAYEAWFVDRDGLVTEGSSTNAWIVLADGTLITRDLKANILAGVTRATVIRGLASAGLKVQERAFSLEEAKAAREAFFTSATGNVMPVVSVDGRTIGNGRPGSITEKVYETYRRLSGAAEN
jgi:D-alanine transaminase